MKYTAFPFALAAFLALPPLAWADFSGKVVGVADGDTITVLDADKVHHRQK